MSKTLEPYLKLMSVKEASDLYFTTGAPPSTKIQGQLIPVSKHILLPGMVKKLAYGILSPKKIEEFERELEMDIGLGIPNIGRYRINIYMQRGEVSMVIRYIKSEIPSIEALGLPPILKKTILNKAGLILVAGATGSGKSSALAALIEYRNANHAGHILTIEDPIEFVFSHKKSIVGQREIGLDTHSYKNALRAAMREAPDLIMIGEIRDADTMEAGITYADTGHLCVSTLHAVNANQALDRITNLFPAKQQNKILMDLALNLRAIVSLRLVNKIDGGRIAAVELMLNTPYIAELIRQGNFHEIKDSMEKGAQQGMLSFDQALFDLYKQDKIELEEALNNADSRTNLEWKINFGSGEHHDTKSDNKKISASSGFPDADIHFQTQQDKTTRDKEDSLPVLDAPTLDNEVQ
ncbi:twitching motility protein PilU [Nitrosomonas sp. Nm51]|uniref:PilT/PilU family type 4a pilus ATPase n=1 Tax=Nitrosomonas sp. Nm51 TaxID=133720 RepID=UPI0008D62188|nr:PilT/PilU family type 4a pilus ATPase [Nitrosomonas sp. Nm51]SER62127.1 twitching motility protein PilU [Nitrosomonas sp. Nm51]